MENLNRLLAAYQEDERISQLADALAKEDPKIQLLGLRGAQAAFIIQAIHQRGDQPHLIIANDKEEAAYLQNTLSNLYQQKKITFFPDSFKRPQYFEVLNAANVLQRAETVNRLSGSKAQNQIIVTYPEALFEQVVAPDVLDSRD